MAYSPQATRVFREGLRRAFPAPEQVEALLSLVDVEFVDITSKSRNLIDNVADVVRWAEQNDRLPQLMDAALAERPDNPWLRQAQRFVGDPELIESRYVARWVPLVTWCLGAIALVLALALVKIWYANLLDLWLWLFWSTVPAAAAYASWRLVARLRGRTQLESPGRFWLWRQLLAHSRLQLKDWAWFAASVLGVILLGALAWRSPSPVTISFHRTSMRADEWEREGFVVVDQLLPGVPEEMELQGPDEVGFNGADAVSQTYYRVELYVGRFNLARNLALEIVLAPQAPEPGSGRGPASGAGSITLQRIALDSGLGSVLDENRRFRRMATSPSTAGGELTEVSTRLAMPLDTLVGHSSILLTCARRWDARPEDRKVMLHARLLQLGESKVLYESPPRRLWDDDWR